jgi:HEAT repeat protein
MKRRQADVLKALILALVLLAGKAPAAETNATPDPQQRVQELVAVIKDGTKFWRERQEAIQALRGGGLRAAAEGAIPALTDVLADRTQILRQSAMQALAEMRPASVPALKQAIEDPRKEVGAVDTFAAMGRDGLPFLSELLGHKNALVRLHAAEALQWTRGAASATAALTGCLGDESEAVREAAVKALGNIGTPAASAVPQLLAIAANQGNPLSLRTAAVQALQRIGAPTTQSLTGTLGDTKAPADIRVAAAGTLGGMGTPVARSLAGILIDKQGDERLRVAAAQALGSVAAPAAEALAKALHDPSAGTAVRVAAAGALRGLGPVAVPTLLSALTAADERVRWHAAVALGGMPAEAVPPIAAKLTDDNVLSRRYAAFALGKMGTKAGAATPALTMALKDREPAVRRNAAGALGAIGGDAKVTGPALAALLKDADPEVCLAAVQAIGGLKKDAADRAKEIEEILSTTRNVKLQWTAAYALDSILGARPVEVKRETLAVRSSVLNKQVRMLDGQWQGTRVAADGNCYFGAGGHWPDQGSAFLRYDPRKDDLQMLSDDLSKVCNEDPQRVPPQGKIHSPVVEKDGWIYFGTHLADYSERGSRAYSDAHLIGYETASGKFRDYGVICPQFTNYSAVGLDAVRDKIYFLCVSFGENYPTRIYRIDIKTGAKEDLGAITPGHGSGFWFVVDRRGDAWLAIREDPAALFHVRGETGKIERWEGALPPGQVCTWDWAGALPGGDLGLVTAVGKIWILDCMADRDAPGAFVPVKDITFAHLGVSMTKGRIYWVPSTRRNDESEMYQAHLMSLSLDPARRPGMVNHGELRDQDGRRCWGIWGLDLDREGRAMTIGRWYALPGEENTIGVFRTPWWCCLAFSVLDVADDFAGGTK